MAEVVMDDMAIGNPESLNALAVALWASFPGIHIAQIPSQVIGNCGVIFLVQCSNDPGQTPWRDRLAFRPDLYGPSIGYFVGTAHRIARWRGAQYDGIVSSAACEHFWRSRGMDLMMAVLLIVGAGLLLAGLLTAGFGIELDLSFGNTLILSGTVVACTGMIMLSLWAVARELQRITLRLGAAVSMETRAGTKASPSVPRNQIPEDDGFSFSRDLPELDDADDVGPPPPPSSTPRREEPATRDRGAPPPVPVETAPAVKPRRNLMFSTSSRKERERGQGRASDPSEADLGPVLGPDLGPAPASESGEVSPPTFDDAWPRAERSRAVEAPPQRRGGRAPPPLAEANGAADRYAPAGRNEDRPSVTILKSGVVDGMAYSLYSDGSIEAQMPEGLMRFTSIDELRAHLDQRS
jgi:hypothetical protein